MQNFNGKEFDAVVIGGGFYGCAIAVYLKKCRGFKHVKLVEQESDLLQRASYTNQARVHNGYHYPRSFTTAYRSRVNLPRFISDWPEAVKTDFTKIYCIARRNSKVTAKQFERFSREIGAKLSPMPKNLMLLFEPRLIEAAYVVDEYAFDTTKLAAWAKASLSDEDVSVDLNSKVVRMEKDATGYSVIFKNKSGEVECARTQYIFNCTYSGLNQIAGDFPKAKTGLKHEITEMALVDLPEPLRGIGVTVMDGPFFSCMPFPAKRLHTLSHVRYTPHLHWSDERGVDPYEKMNEYHSKPRVDRMIRDVSRYIPSMSKAQYVESLFEVKTVLVKNEGDDGRPILFETYAGFPGCYSVLGGKIDNIYDVYEKLDQEPLILSSGPKN